MDNSQQLAKTTYCLTCKHCGAVLRCSTELFRNHPKLWKCKYPWKDPKNFVTGLLSDKVKYCEWINSNGNCIHYQPIPPVDIKLSAWKRFFRWVNRY